MKIFSIFVSSIQIRTTNVRLANSVNDRFKVVKSTFRFLVLKIDGMPEVVMDLKVPRNRISSNNSPLESMIHVNHPLLHNKFYE